MKENRRGPYVRRNRINMASAKPLSAYELASKIRAYWEKRGYYPVVTVEKQKLNNRSFNGKSIEVVRSDMVNGLPRVFSNGK